MKYFNCRRAYRTYKNKFYDIENIITKRNDGKTNYYLIKWKGYAISDCTWEPISNLFYAMEMVKEFEENFPFSINHKLLNEFLIEFKKHKQHFKKKSLKKQKIKKEKENKIIIYIDNMDLDNKNEENKECEISKTESNPLVEKNEENINKDNKLNIFNIEKNDSETSININQEKLKRPTLIW